LLEAQALTDSYYGRLQKSRRGFQQAIEAARKDDAREDAALLRIKAALVEAEVGNAARVRQIVKQAPAPTRGEDQGIVGLALARAGQTAEAEKIADELEREFPSYTMMQRYWVPRIRAAIALERNNPQQVVAFLQIGMPYEMGNTSFGNLYPFYLRGEAYLKAGQGRLAAAAFQKMLDHPGILMNFVTGALAHLQLARAQAMMGDKAAARKSYQNFLTLWKDADPDIPIYKQAQAEYAKLK
jgi:tetratricopeptide (TPR) repeat protein